jgi:catechol 2,3-dioxygenase-like lactoylglutathione lyase family enzyme
MAVATKAPVVERIDHWTLVASDVERTLHFYTDVLGAEATRPAGANRGGGPVSVKLANTIIDFFESSDHQAPSPGGFGQHHCYVVREADFDTWRQRFASVDVPLTYAIHGSRMSLMFDDPDGYHFEFTVPFETREQAQQELRNRGLTVER